MTLTETALPKRRGSTIKETVSRFCCGTLPPKTIESSFGKDSLPSPTVSMVHLAIGSYYNWDSGISHFRFEDQPHPISDSQIDSQMSYLVLRTMNVPWEDDTLHSAFVLSDNYCRQLLTC